MLSCFLSHSRGSLRVLSVLLSIFPPLPTPIAVDPALFMPFPISLALHFSAPLPLSPSMKCCEDVPSPKSTTPSTVTWISFLEKTSAISRKIVGAVGWTKVGLVSSFS
ncbi:hypothetical protein NE237_023428 [Protea cynaroides]|uniref:Uncharacterized protein n=1 Tax=Protea cynaroides TaxID=273540 RepID=A0A9Q0HH38_9MAGN|nr:hypothetical protein NE237_023428 [Protea cynaroides]